MIKKELLDNLNHHFANLDTIATSLEKYIEGNISGHNLYNFIEYLLSLKLTRPKILEIGFNAGHSAFLFSQIFNKSAIISIDNISHKYVNDCFEYVQNNSESFHLLIKGDSIQCVPMIISSFDLIFIDGGHFDTIPQADLLNCQKLANSNTIVIMDDICDAAYGINPTKYWNECASKMINEVHRWKSEDGSTGYAAGKYII